MEAPATDQPALTTSNNNNAPDLSPALSNSISSSSEPTSTDAPAMEAPAMEAPATDQPALTSDNNNAPDLSPALSNSISPAASQPPLMLLQWRLRNGGSRN